jgi:hypothetical protein
MQRNFSVFVRVTAVDQASVKRPRVDVQADGSLIKLGQVEHLVHRFFGVYFGGQESMNVERVCGLQTTKPGGGILIDDPEVLHSKLAGRNSHPAVLIVVVVYLRGLPYFPANCYQLEQIILEYQISRVVVLAEEDVRLERAFIDRMTLEKIINRPDAKVFFWNRTESGDELIYCNDLDGSANGHIFGLI